MGESARFAFCNFVVGPFCARPRQKRVAVDSKGEFYPKTRFVPYPEITLDTSKGAGFYIKFSRLRFRSRIATNKLLFDFESNGNEVFFLYYVQFII